MEPPIAWYREYLPPPALRGHVYASFSFLPGTSPAPPGRVVLREVAIRDPRLCSPQFADAHASVVFELGRRCHADGRWRQNPMRPQGTVTGPLSHVGRVEGSAWSEMVGAYFRPARLAPFIHCPVSDLANTSVCVTEAWRTTAADLADHLCEVGEGPRLERLEGALLARVNFAQPSPSQSVNIEGVAIAVRRQRGQVVIDDLARAAGITRQHLSRVFRHTLGVSPKLYARLARFQAGLVYVGRRAGVDWAQAAADMGYADQSHMIAEFREFSSMTPHQLATSEWFHPFIERAKPR